jgi:hypothetical protein
VKSSLLLAGLFVDSPTTVVEPGRHDHTERLLGAGCQRAMRATRSPLWAADLNMWMSRPGDFRRPRPGLCAGVLHPSAEVRIRNVGPIRRAPTTDDPGQMGANVNWHARRGG